jgi:predicted component of type VI protein secretion system
MAFLQVYFNDELKFTVPLELTETRIGRAADNNIVIDNKGVSGHHAVIVKDKGSFYIIDNNSTNGVFVNGLCVSQSPLSYGDEITIFKHKLKFVAVDLVAKKESSHHNAIFEDATVFISSAQIMSIVQQQQQKKEKQVAYLLQNSGTNQGKRWLLKEQNLEIGKGKNCHFHTGGWFAPRLSASIVRQSNGYYVVPKKGGKVYLNMQLIEEPIKLRNNDNLKIRCLDLTFYQPLDWDET